ncbi:MAG: serine/threonine-protein kinase [Planctomycetia bacterium]|nr:serine/threonine-protein kinase [Planctomycetia bacterium]
MVSNRSNEEDQNPSFDTPQGNLDSTRRCPSPRFSEETESRDQQFNTHFAQPTVSARHASGGLPPNELVKTYAKLTSMEQLSLRGNMVIKAKLGTGGQGDVYFAESTGADGFVQPVALKFFSPEPFRSEEDYCQAMSYNAAVASRIASIQHDNIAYVRSWVSRDSIRIMEMEWVDGYDLQRLQSESTLRWMRKHLSPNELKFRLEVVIAPGKERPRLKPGISLTAMRNCLSALKSLHENGIVHCDLKPANIMLKRTGCSKIIDYGAACFYTEDAQPSKLCTPRYAAPEILSGARPTPQSDICSLGYVLIELLGGLNLFVNPLNPQKGLPLESMIRQKKDLPEMLTRVLPGDVSANADLVEFCRKMIHPDLDQRFATADDAIVLSDGLSNIMRGLITAKLASEFDFDIRAWLSNLDLDRRTPSS